MLPHHDEQASDNRNPTKHGQTLSSNMLLLNFILLIDVTFSTPTFIANNPFETLPTSRVSLTCTSRPRKILRQ